MSESVEEFLARGGQVNSVPPDAGKKETAHKGQGDALRPWIAREAETARGSNSSPVSSKNDGE